MEIPLNRPGLRAHHFRPCQDTRAEVGCVPEFDYRSGFTGNPVWGENSPMPTTSLTAINAFLLAFSWQSDPDFTCTVQTSRDLLHWQTLPYVFQGRNEGQSLTLLLEEDRLFARLQYSDDGDSNENGLPDLWEWKTFGHLEVDPDGDPDGDGITTYEEWLAGTDPLDYYNGHLAILHVASGFEWIVPAGQTSAQALALSILDKSGQPQRNAPVHLWVEGGYAGLLEWGDAPEAAVPELVAYTDHLGRIDPGSHAIHFLAPAEGGSLHFLHIETGGVSQRILLKSVVSGIGDPPRMVRLESGPDDSIGCSWSGNPAGANRFRVEQLAETGDWMTLLDVPIDTLPDPDPLTGRYHLLLTGSF